MFDSVLMVCVGNICRSPMAMCFLQYLCELEGKDLQVSSAGVHALVGHAADDQACRLMKEKSMNIDAHRAQQLSAGLASQYDLILVMEKGHVHAVTDIAPQTRGRVHLLGKWHGDEEIADPYQKSEAHFRAACSAIERNTKLWKKYL